MKKFPVFRAVLHAAAAAALTSRAARAQPVINEFLAVNHGPSFDDFQQTSDWIEIKNPGPGPVDLAGWSLTDEPDLHAKWIFPSITLNAGEFLLLRASGLDRREPSAMLHTNFTLSGGGEFLGLYSPTDVASTVWQPYPKQFTGISYGFVFSGASQGYFTTPTPGVDNELVALTDYVRDTQFSVDRGFFTAPFTLGISVSTPGAVIRYTDDGCEPQENFGAVYAGPITISTTTVIRARAFRDGMVPSNADTQTYVFPSAWKAQPDFPPDFPETWGLAEPPFSADSKDLADYGMNTAITGNAEYGPLVIPAMTQTLPVLCLTGRVTDIFGDSGIHGDLRQTDVEVPVGVEFFDPVGGSGQFTARAALQTHGGAVRNFPKKAFRIDFTGAFGDGPLEFPLFAGSTAESFDQLVLRPGGHDSFTVRGRGGNIDNNDLAFHAGYLRDQFMRRTENALGLLSPRGRYVHLCLNGLYWGLYELHERPNAEFCATNAGGDPAVWDVLHHNNFSSSGPPQVLDGSEVAWNELQTLSAGPVSEVAAYQQLAALLGPDGFIDHLLVRMWAADHDWLGPAYSPGVAGNVAKYFTKNWYAVRDTRAAAVGPWRFFSWDGEIAMGNHLLWIMLDDGSAPPDLLFPSYLLRKLDLDLTGISKENTPAAPWAALGAHPEFRLKVADRARRLLFHGGALSPAAAAARIAALELELDLPMVAESARWGAVAGRSLGFRNSVKVRFWDSLPVLTRNTHWRPEVAWLRDTFCAQRAGIFLNQLRARNLYPAVEPVEITPFGGIVSEGGTIALAAPAGTIYYTLDGTDPRTAFNGIPASGAVTYAGPFAPPAGGAPFSVNARALDGTAWSALTEANFSRAIPPLAASLAITEIHYHPADPTPGEIAAGFTDADDFEFLEITNVSADAVSLTTLRFAAGIDFDFGLHSNRRELAAGASMVIASHAAAFRMRYGFSPAGVFANDTRLSNSGERLKLVTADGLTIAELTYNDRGGWPEAADGSGPSLVLMAPFSGTVEDDSDHWRASTELGGNPGMVGGISYAAWLGDYFTAAEIADPLVTGALANPEGDGLANLTEYAVRTNPWRASNHPVRVTGLPDGGVRFTWERRADAADITGELQLSTGLQSWLPAFGEGITIGNSNTTRGTVAQTVDCVAATGIRFARLVVSLTP
jgi:CotH kinase protein/Chitobiase/beta-hexosaminidase C-terminal domain/Lamin Tail Domain